MVSIQRSCDVENISDFSRYYVSSWIGWHEEDSIKPCFVSNMLDGNHIQLRPLYKNTDGRLILGGSFPVDWDTLKANADFGSPDIGMMPEGPTVMFCSYTTPRMAKKGYRPLDTRNYDFNNWAIRNKYVYQERNKNDWIWFAFNPEYKTLEQAEDVLWGGRAVGAPLSRTLGVYSLPKFRNSLLAYKRWTIGHVITPTLIHLKREYGDYEEDVAQQTGAEVVVG